MGESKDEIPSLCKNKYNFYHFYKPYSFNFGFTKVSFSSRSNRPFGLPQSKKRKIENPGMAMMAKSFAKTLEPIDEKRRKKSEEHKSLVLPQKKRVLPPSNVGSPAKKSPKLTASDEGAAEETLIRETEAALKNLSGSWPGPRTGYGSHQEESPPFENLFAEKKANVKMSPSSASNSSSDNTCSLKDVITLREQHEHEEGSDDKITGLKSRSKVVECKQKTVKKGEMMQYESHDFNELVDDSSNELEIDMSEAASEKNESNDKLDEERKKDEGKPSKYPNEQVFHSFPRASTTIASPFSTTSAFRPPQSTKNPPLGPFPAEATFVGYPTIADPSTTAEDKSKTIVPLKPTESQVESQVKSPEAANKQYTILQPANISSRAASTLQEVAREGVQCVPAVSGTPVSEAPTKMVPPMVVAGSLSPNSIGRG